jgi:hypothetical protein
VGEALLVHHVNIDLRRAVGFGLPRQATLGIHDSRATLTQLRPRYCSRVDGWPSVAFVSGSSTPIQSGDVVRAD